MESSNIVDTTNIFVKSYKNICLPPQKSRKTLLNYLSVAKLLYFYQT